MYKPAYTKEQFLEIVSRKIVEGVSCFSLDSALVHFVDYRAKMEPGKSDEPLELASALVKSSSRDNMDILSAAALFSKGTTIVKNGLRCLLSPETLPP